MWEESPQKADEEENVVPAKRPRGRPRKHSNFAPKKDDVEIIKSEFVSCCALGCPNTSESYIMNCLPRDSKLKQKWVEKIDRLDWAPDDDSALCEVHFEPDSWDVDAGEEKILKHTAVPTLYLHGEAIKSWVTLDSSGNMEDVLGPNVTTGDEKDDNDDDEDIEEEEQKSESEEEDPEVIVKREVLEPEIDMVEGSEDVLSRDTSSTEEQFETIYCDSTFNEDEEDSSDVQPHGQEASMGLEMSRSELENPLNLDSIASDDRQIQDRQVSCMADAEGKKNSANFLVISQPHYKKVIRRRSSSMLNDDFQCPICERRLSRRKNLEIHMEKLHPNGELSEYQKRKKAEQIVMKEQPTFKKPPPPLTPIVPTCLLTSPLTLPQPKMGTLVSTSQPATPTLLTTTMVTASSPLDPSPAGGEMKKQFLLLLPKPMEAPASPAPAPPEQPKPPIDDPLIFSLNLYQVSSEKRAPLKEKLRELVEAVMTKNLNPEKIIIAYDRT
ncbi:DNA binding [Homalodisca vitripennis]|nr:DNA binding [Homalodisca vitripennis]